MKKIILGTLSALFLLSGCDKENEINQMVSEVSVEPQITSTLLTDYEIPPNDIYYLQKLGFSGSTAKVLEKYDSSSGDTYIVYLLEGDIEFRADKLTQHLPFQALTKEGGLTSQYRTSVIASPNTYTVAISTYPLLYGTMNMGIQNAIQNYNNLNLGINFVLTSATTAGARKNCNNDPNCIFVGNSSSVEGGQAGFPYNNGKPYKHIQLNTYLGDDYGVDVVEHVMTHELGHCIGLRHTDWYDRQCTLTPGNEGQTQYGAIHIPGTPTTFNQDFNSIMMACFSANETGEFTNYDITALQELW